MGGNTIIGLDYINLLEMFRNDEQTEQVVLIGAIGGNAEEIAAKYILKTHYPKPVVFILRARWCPPSKRIGRARTIILGNAGTSKSKIEAYDAADVPVAEKPSDIVKL
jgi:succinyl-CoA synthetase alpha subunit